MWSWILLGLLRATKDLSGFRVGKQRLVSKKKRSSALKRAILEDTLVVAVGLALAVFDISVAVARDLIVAI